MIPLVTIAEFESITCNQCGDCCERFWFDDPFTLAARAWMPAHFWDTEQAKRQRRWELEALIPLESIPSSPGRLAYGCRFFERDTDDAGRCMIHGERPPTCAEFPYGRPMPAFPRCSWNVEIDLMVWDGTG